MHNDKFIVKCDYTDRDYVKDICFWSNKHRAWTLNATLMNYEIVKSQRFVNWEFPEEIDSLFQSKLKLNLDFHLLIPQIVIVLVYLMFGSRLLRLFC